MLYRIGGIYLWVALILASSLMDVRSAAGLGAVLVAGAVHLALLVAKLQVADRTQAVARANEAGFGREESR